jgi:hypothetical protein
MTRDDVLCYLDKCRKTEDEDTGNFTKNNVPIDTLNPKICPNCNEGNTQDAKFCTKVK